MLSINSMFYPFAAVKKGRIIQCVFSDNELDSNAPTELIEILQWKLIDQSIDTSMQSLLAYSADVHTSDRGWRSAIAVDICDEDGQEHFLTFSYQKQDGKVRFYGPLTIKQ
jgi:hypothetical protein